VAIILDSFLLAAAKQNQSGLIAVAGVLSGVIVTKAVDWFFEKRRHSYEQKQTAAAVMAELEAIVQIIVLRQYQHLLAQNIEFMTRTGKVANPKIPIRENFMPVYTANIAKIGLLPHPVPSNLALLYTFGLAIKEEFRTLCDFTDKVDGQFLILFEKNLLLLLNLTMALADETIADLRAFLGQRLGPHLKQKHDEATQSLSKRIGGTRKSDEQRRRQRSLKGSNSMTTRTNPQSIVSRK